MAVVVAGTPTTKDIHASGTTALPLAVPSGATSGEVLVAHVSVGENGGSITAPSGWTTLRTGHDNGTGGARDTIVWVGYRLVASEPSSYSWSFSSVTYAMGTMWRLAGVNTTTPIRTSAADFSQAARSQIEAGPALSGVQATDAAWYFFAAGDDAGTTLGPFADPGQPWTSRANRTIGTKGIYVCSALGAQTPPTATATTVNTTWTSIGVAFQVAAGGDVTAPTVPSSVTATANSATQVTVSWTASTDAVGVASYRVLRGGTTVASAVTSGTSFVDTAVLPSTAYSYTVSAVDAAGNRSAESTAAAVTTPAGVVPKLTLTATVQASNVPPRVRIDLNDTRSTPAGQVTVIRNNADGSTSTVRTSDGNALPLTSGVGLIYDYEMSYGTAVSYSTIEVPTATTTQVTVPVSRPWLVHIGVPSLSQPIQLRPGSLTKVTYATSRGVYRVMGRSAPVIQTDGSRGAASSSMTLLVTSIAALQAVQNLISDSQVLLLNIPAGLGYTFPTAYVSIADVSVAPSVGDKVTETYLDVTMPFDVVDTPVGGSQAQRTFADLLVYPSIDVLNRAYPSLNALTAGP